MRQFDLRERIVKTLSPVMLDCAVRGKKPPECFTNVLDFARLVLHWKRSTALLQFGLTNAVYSFSEIPVKTFDKSWKHFRQVPRSDLTCNSLYVCMCTGTKSSYGVPITNLQLFPYGY